MDSERRTGRRWAVLLLLVYGAGMLWLLFDRAGHNTHLPYWESVRLNLNLVPLETIRRYLYVLCHMQHTGLVRTAVINLAGNVVLFVPLGIFLPVLVPRQRRLGWFLLTFSLIIWAVEVTQLFTLRGICDVDDYLLNLLGGLLGWLLYRLTVCIKTNTAV